MAAVDTSSSDMFSNKPLPQDFAIMLNIRLKLASSLSRLAWSYSLCSKSSNSAEDVENQLGFEPTEADVPPEMADLDTQWAFIRTGIERIMPGPGKSSEVISYHYYGLFYSSIYRYCTTSQKVSPEQGSQLSNENLYKHLIQWLGLYCDGITQQIDNLEDDQLLDFYGSEWGLFSSNVTHLNRLFSYLNRCWIKRSALQLVMEGARIPAFG
ncbi:uncharacterized protein IAS62_006377 [Cryptococcus decagattii]|uniref:Cullin N-terminal domain-containing protein n=1 Tax=Cryptococcus decagattii TaxID=1859122 RepID=A0ABZ2B6E7_9TREE